MGAEAVDEHDTKRHTEGNELFENDLHHGGLLFPAVEFAAVNSDLEQDRRRQGNYAPVVEG